MTTKTTKIILAFGVFTSLLLMLNITRRTKNQSVQAKYTPADTAIILVDLQNDFTEANDGTLAVRGGTGTKQAYLDEVGKAQKFLYHRGFFTVATKDWHPQDHASFASNHVDVEEYGDIKYDNGKPGTAWPNHCVQGTRGAAIVDQLKGLYHEEVHKGMDKTCECYSGFGNDNGKETELLRLLKNREGAKIANLIVFGLATDYCVKCTALDGKKAGYNVIVVEDLCRAVDLNGSLEEAKKKMGEAGISFINFADLKKEILGT